MARGASRDRAQTASEYVSNFEQLTSDFDAASAFARVYGLNLGTEQARAEALAIYEFIDSTSRPTIKMTELRYYSFLLMHFGHSLKVSEIWKPKTNATFNKRIYDIVSTYELEPTEWFPKFQALFGKIGGFLSPTAPGDNAFRTLASSDRVKKVQGDSLVSVIMTTYKPGADAEHAINSILAQSYQNFELIIVDDGSGSEFHPLLEKFAKKDDRIRLVLLEKNVGTYGARNAGWLHANGRYLTGQDSDDWAHPLRLELQVKNLDDNPHIVGNWCQGVRVNEHLQIDIRDGNAPLRRGSHAVAVSMMIRMSPAFLRLGFFDSARKAADSEYIQRLRTAFGSNAFAEIQELLYVIQARYDSLSRTDFTPGWRHQNRQLYASMYTRWHKTLDILTNPAYFMPLTGKRSFPAPFAFTPEGKRGVERKFDLLVIGDFFWGSSRQTWLLKHVQSAIAAGKSVAFAQVASPFATSTRVGMLSEQVSKLYESWAIDFVALDDQNVKIQEVLTTTEFLAFGEPVPSNLAVTTLTVGAFADRSKGLDEVAETFAQTIFPKAKLTHEVI
jgi:glycosyltransferase involved in cell wall biosynthesis